MAKRKQQAQAVVQEPKFSDYESGLLDALNTLQAILSEMSEEFRPAVMTGANNAAGHFLGGAASHAQNLLGSVRNEMEKRVLRTLNERRQAQRDSEETP